MTKINLDTIKSVKPVKSTEIYSCKTWKVFINENWKVFFQYEKAIDENKIKELNSEIEQLERELETVEDFYEEQMTKSKISRLEKRIEFENSTTRFWRYFVMLEWNQVSDFQDCLQNAREPENIWSALFNTWLSFWDSENNLDKNLSDKQLDKMTVSEATSWKEERKALFPRTRETDF